MKLAMVAAKVANVAIGIAVLVTNPRRTIQIGCTMALPPTPAIVQRALKNRRAKMPAISIRWIGNVFLCLQVPGEAVVAVLFNTELALVVVFDV